MIKLKNIINEIFNDIRIPSWKEVWDYIKHVVVPIYIYHIEVNNSIIPINSYKKV